MLIYKIFRDSEWADLRAQGQTDGAPIDIADGYIHFSPADLVVETAAKHFAGEEDLWLIALETEKLGDTLRWEVSRGGASFPHLYRKMHLDDVFWAKPLPHHLGRQSFPDCIEGHIDPTRSAFDAFKALNRDRTLDMLNLVRCRATARYSDASASTETKISGREAYQRYSAASESIFGRVGGEVVWRGTFETALIGPVDEAWDHMFIARYPSAHAFLEMVTDPDYAKAVIHRQAAVRTSRLIRCAPAENGIGFA